MVVKAVGVDTIHITACLGDAPTIRSWSMGLSPYDSKDIPCIGEKLPIVRVMCTGENSIIRFLGSIWTKKFRTECTERSRGGPPYILWHFVYERKTNITGKEYQSPTTVLGYTYLVYCIAIRLGTFVHSIRYNTDKKN